MARPDGMEYENVRLLKSTIDTKPEDLLRREQTYSVYYKTIMYMFRFNSQKGFIFYPMEHDDPAKEVQEFQI